MSLSTVLKPLPSQSFSLALVSVRLLIRPHIGLASAFEQKVTVLARILFP
jgi:hypothetical protein